MGEGEQTRPPAEGNVVGLAEALRVLGCDELLRHRHEVRVAEPMRTIRKGEFHRFSGHVNEIRGSGAEAAEIVRLEHV